MRRAAGLIALLLAAPAAAEAPDASLRPIARPVDAAAEADAPAISPGGVALTELLAIPRPVLRHEAEVGPVPAATPDPDNYQIATSPQAPRLTDRPALRPAALTQRAAPPDAAPTPAPAAPARTGVRGAICDDPAIIGEVIADIDGPGACGVLGAVEVRSVAGIPLSEAATIDCNTARALRRWVSDGIVPAVGATGGGVKGLRIMGHYTCRNRVGGSAGNAKMSEHGRGRAVDIGGIQLQNGTEITVLTDWGRGTAGQQLKAMWRSACGPFGTVLGPESNAAHRDHFHVDTARYRNGTYCR